MDLVDYFGGGFIIYGMTTISATSCDWCFKSFLPTSNGDCGNRCRLLGIWYVSTQYFEPNIVTHLLFVMIIAGIEQIVKDIRFMLDFGLGIYWKFTWCIFIPVALSVIFIYAMV